MRLNPGRDRRFLPSLPVVRASQGGRSESDCNYLSILRIVAIAARSHAASRRPPKPGSIDC